MELRIKDILAQKGMTLKDFSLQTGISASNLSNYIKGNISPTLDTLEKIALGLGVDVVELFREKEDIEFYAKLNGMLYPISKSDIVDIITHKYK